MRFKIKDVAVMVLCVFGPVFFGKQGDAWIFDQAAPVAAKARIAPGPVVVRAKTTAEGKTLPVPGVTVRIGGRYAPTSADGTAVFDGLPAGAYKLRIEHRGFHRLERDIELPPGRREPIDAELVGETLADVNGLVTAGETGRPLAGAVLNLTPLAVPSVIQGRYTFSSNWDGKFTVLQIPTGKYKADVSAPGCGPWSAEIEVKKGMPELTFSPARETEAMNLDVKVRDSVSGNPIAGAKVVWAECWPKGIIGEAVTGADGTAVFNNLKTGRLNWMDAQDRCSVGRRGGTFRVEAVGYEPIVASEPSIPLSPLAKIAEQKPNGTLAQAQVIATGPPVEFKISQRGEKSVFRFRIPYPAAVKVTVGPNNPIQTYVRLFNAEGQQLAESGALVGLSNVIEQRRRAGDYYVQIEEWENNDSSAAPLTLRVSADYAADPFEPNDSPESARLIRTNEEVRGRIFPKGDVDFFRFELPRTGRIRLTMPPAGFQRMIFVRDARGQVVGNQGCGAGAAIDLQVQLSPGSYTLDVHEWEDNDSSLEPYTLKMEAMADDGIDDPPVNPGPLSALRVLPLNGLAGSTINPLGDSDTYAVSIPGPGVLHVEGLSVTQLYVQAFAPDGKLLAAQGSGARSPIHFTWPAGGPTTVYLRVYEWESNDWSPSPYKLFDWFEPGDELDAMGRNDTFDTATPAFLGESLRGNIDPIGDVDIYRVEVDHPGYMRIEGVGKTQLFLRIFDGKQNKVAERGAGAGYVAALRPQVFPGTYYLMVREWEDNDWHSSPYALQIKLERADPSERVPLAADPVRPLQPGEAQSYAIDHLGDKDRFLFTLPQAGKFSIRLWNSLQAYVRLFDDQTGKVVHESGYGSGQNPKIDLEAKGPTRYRLEIEEWENNDCSLQRQYVLVNTDEKKLTAEDIEAKVDPFDPTLVTFTRAPIKGIDGSAKVLVDAMGDGRIVEELPAGAAKTVRYPSEGAYTATAHFSGADGSKTVQRFWVDAVGALERKGVFLVVDHPSEGQTVERDLPCRVRAMSFSGARIQSISLAVDGSEIGRSYSLPYEFEVPWRSLGGGKHVLTLTAADTTGEKAVVKRTVDISEYFDLQPADNSALSGNNIRVSWMGKGFGRAAVRYRLRGEPDWKEAEGENGTNRIVALSGLEAGKAYEFQPLGGGEPGPVRSVTRIKGLAFGRSKYGAVIARDYDQRLPISVRNHAEKPQTVRLECGKPDDPLLLIGFVGEGSEGAPFTLNPGEEREFMLGISAQDVVRPAYAFPIRLASENGFSDEAGVELNVKLPTVKLEWVPAGDMPDGLGKKFSLVNTGDALTDLDVFAGPGISLVPAVSHAVFPAGASLMFTAHAILHDGFRGIEGNLTARAVGKQAVQEVKILLPEGKSVFGVLLLPGQEAAAETGSHEALLLAARAMAGSYLDPSRVDWTRKERGQDVDADGILDRWNIEDKEEGILWVGDDTDKDGQIDFVHADIGFDGQFDYSAFRVKDGWEATNLVEAWLEMGFSLPWARNQYEKHDLDIVLNGVVIAGLKDVIPEGNYTFKIPPAALKAGPGEKNVVEVRSRHLRGGHYVVNSDFRIKTRMTGSRVWVVAGSEEEARSSVYNIEGVSTRGADYAVSSSEILVETPQGLQKGAEVFVTVPVRNVGATRTADVEVALLRAEPGGAGVELARVRLKDVPLMGPSPARLPWKAGAGIHQLKIVVDPDEKAGDGIRQNNEAMVTLTVPGDDAKPSLKVLEPAEGSVVTDTILALKAEAKDDGGIARVLARVDGGLWQEFSSSGGDIYEARCLLQPGAHQITMGCVDGSGNRVEQTVKVTVQTEAPAIEILSPAEGVAVDERKIKVKIRCGPDAVLAAFRINGGPCQRLAIRDGLAETDADVRFGKVDLEAMAANKRGALRVGARSLSCTKQPDPQAIPKIPPPAGASGGLMEIEGVGAVDLFGPPNRIFPPSKTQESGLRR